MSIAVHKLMTAEELLEQSEIGRCELIYGELVMMSPAGAEHGVIAGRLFRAISQFVESGELGQTFAAETGFKLASDPDLVRAPDASYVSKARLSAGIPKGFFNGAPDLAVEVISPTDSNRAIREKINAWLAHGSTSVWVADPSTMRVTIYRAGETPESFGNNEILMDERTMPNFKLPLHRLFVLL